MTSRVMLRALACVAVSATMLLGTAVPARALAVDSGQAIAAPSVRQSAAATLAAVAVVPLVVRGEPLASRNPAVTYSLSRVARLSSVKPSAYVGSFYDKRFEKKRRCIQFRESNGSYTVRSANGKYLGAYQMNPGLGRAVTFLMARSLRAEVGPAQATTLLVALRARPVNRWSRYWQDRAFWTIFNHGRGAAHWAGGYVSC
jgi:hypothetical protein